MKIEIEVDEKLWAKALTLIDKDRLIRTLEICAHFDLVKEIKRAEFPESAHLIDKPYHSFFDSSG